jgi:hypothetical protein
LRLTTPTAGPAKVRLEKDVAIAVEFAARVAAPAGITAARRPFSSS